MKTRNLLLTSLLSLGMLAACTTDDDPGMNNENGNVTGETAKAQIMISVATSANTRTTTEGSSGSEVDASDAENNIKSITVVLADENDIAQQVISPDMETEIKTKKEVRATKPFDIPAGEYKVYVLANYKENQDALSPVIIGSTNMKTAFGITGTLSIADQFLMSNAEDVNVTDFSEAGTDTEVDDDGAAKTGEGVAIVKLVTANIERVVAKVTLDNTDEQKFEVNEENASGTDVKVADAYLVGADLINENKKTYITKQKDAEVTPSPLPWTGWYYVKDPNYSKVATGNLGQEFDGTAIQPGYFKEPANAVFYCPENTMAADAQLNGQTTGVVYKVRYEPVASVFTSVSASDGTSVGNVYAGLVQALSSQSPSTSIPQDFWSARDTEGDKTFYTYNGLLFANKKAALLYEKLADANGSYVGTLLTAYNNIVNGATTSSDNVQVYAEGYAYYIAWIRHNPAATAGNMEAGKYGVVRNHWYELKVNSISGLGNWEPKPENPEDPDDPAVAKIQVQATVKKWTLVKQNVDL